MKTRKKLQCQGKKSASFILANVSEFISKYNQIILLPGSKEVSFSSAQSISNLTNFNF